jgi:hypothetical protein
VPRRRRLRQVILMRREPTAGTLEPLLIRLNCIVHGDVHHRPVQGSCSRRTQRAGITKISGGLSERSAGCTSRASRPSWVPSLEVSQS